MSSKERVLANQVASYWTSFARDGQPTPSAGAPAWPRFGAANLTLRLDTELAVVGGVHGSHCDFWDARLAEELR